MADDFDSPRPDGGPAFKSDLFYGNLDEWQEYNSQAKAYLAAIGGTDSLRLIVLETWLFIDYTIRWLLLFGLNLDEVDSPELDLRYSLLPADFRRCVQLIQKLRDFNLGRPEKPEQPWQWNSAR
jgi:hypothetical protein